MVGHDGCRHRRYGRWGSRSRGARVVSLATGCIFRLQVLGFLLGRRRGPAAMGGDRNNASGIVRHHEHPSGVDPVVVDECPAVGLQPAPVHLVDHEVEAPVAQVLLGNDREAVAWLDHVDLCPWLEPGEAIGFRGGRGGGGPEAYAGQPVLDNTRVGDVAPDCGCAYRDRLGQCDL